MENSNERKPYESPAVIYDAKMEVRACTQGGTFSQAPSGVTDLFDPANTTK
jgi:hypothetical protein